eukprot:11022497-Ditylum_brightwellii.AAC.1
MLFATICLGHNKDWDILVITCVLQNLRRRDGLVVAEMEMVVTGTGLTGTAHIPYLVPSVIN